MTTLSLEKRSSDSCSYKQAKKQKNRSVRILVRAEKKRRAFPFIHVDKKYALCTQKKDRLFEDLEKLIKRDGVSCSSANERRVVFSFLHEMVRYAGFAKWRCAAKDGTTRHTQVTHSVPRLYTYTYQSTKADAITSSAGRRIDILLPRMSCSPEVCIPQKGGERPFDNNCCRLDSNICA